jgi:2-polyprenyl-3-methyl-5-hydroxy-6-metoxy-1,4-benzoquinol methylase
MAQLCAHEDLINMTVELWPAEDLEFVPNCPVCGGADRTLLYTDLTDRVFGIAPGKWMLYRCLTCKSAWLDPRPNQATIGKAYEHYYTHVPEDDIAALPKSALVRQLHSWQNDYKNARYGLERRPAGRFGRWLVSLVPSLQAKANTQCRHLLRPPVDGGRLLDIGFGNGGFLKIAGEMGWNAEGIDFDPKAVEVARARGLNVRCASAADLSEHAGQYDVITISHVIEHVYDPPGLLEDLYRLLKPGGSLWLDTPNLSSLGAQRFGRNWQALDPPRHLTLFTPNSLRGCLEKAGFKNVTWHWHGMVLFSTYAESTAIARGYCAQSARQQVMPSIAAIFAELREMVNPARREFLTITAYKSP